METEKCRAQAIVREDYRTLVHADAEIEIPSGMEKVTAFYRSVVRAAVRWAEEAEGKRAREAYAAINDIWEKSRFVPAVMRLRGTCHLIDEVHFAVVCEAVLTRGSERETRCAAQVWNRVEETLLPMREILRRWLGQTRQPKLGYHADGCYPINGEVVFFRNPRGTDPFQSTRGRFEKKSRKGGKSGKNT